MESSENPLPHTISLPKINQSDSSPTFIEKLKKDIAILQIEARHCSRINSELESKLEWYNEVSSALSIKLRTLWWLAGARSRENNEIKEFTDQISLSWSRVNKQVFQEYYSIRVASRTICGTPLSTLLERIRKEAHSIKLTLQTDGVAYDQEFALINEIMTLTRNLGKCDDKVQQYLAVCKMTPYLVKLESAIERFVMNTELLPIPEKTSCDLTAFTILTKLLTGELLDEDTVINPNSVLAAHEIKKPIFITKNNKRKMDLSYVPGDIPC